MPCRVEAYRALREARRQRARPLDLQRSGHQEAGEAPAALEGLDPPDAIFVGGGLSEGVFLAAWNALKPLGRLVANAVTLESEAELLRLQALLLLRQSHKGTDAVEAAFVAALDSARRSGAGLHDLRVSVSFAGYLFQSGRLREAAAATPRPATVNVNMELFSRRNTAPQSTIVGDPFEHERRKCCYAAHNLSIGASWELTDWYRANFEPWDPDAGEAASLVDREAWAAS